MISKGGIGMADDWYKKEHKLPSGEIFVEAVCKKCGVIGQCDVTIGPFGPHYAKANCKSCGNFVKWVHKNLSVKTTRTKK